MNPLMSALFVDAQRAQIKGSSESGAARAARRRRRAAERRNLR